MKNGINEKNKILFKITIDQFYYVDSSINGWDEKTIFEDWFEDIPISQSHATRDSYKIGNCDKIRNIKVLKRGKFQIIKEDLK